MATATALSRKGLVGIRLLWITRFGSPVAALAFISWSIDRLLSRCAGVRTEVETISLKFALSLTFLAFLSICSLDVWSWTVVRSARVLLGSGFSILSALMIGAFMMMSVSTRTLRRRSMSCYVPVPASADSLSLYTIKFSLIFFYLSRRGKVLSNHFLNISGVNNNNNNVFL